MSENQLHRESPDPLYQQLKDSITEAIQSGRYQPHQRLPSERDFSNTFQVSRMTVRQALLDLAREGLIYTRVGKGTFVAGPKIDQRLEAVTGFSQDVLSRGGQPSSRVLETRLITPPLDVAAALRISSSAQVVQLTRLRLANGEPLAIETAFLPSALVPNLLRYNFASTSLYDVLEREYHFTLIQAEQTIEAALASPRESELLQLTAPAAVLKMQRLTQIADSTPIEYVLSVYHGDRYKFHSVLQPRSGAL